MPAVFQIDLGRHLQELKPLFLERISQDVKTRAAYNETVAESYWRTPVDERESAERLDHLLNYAKLASDRVIDTTIDGVPVLLITQTKFVRDGVLDDHGLSAEALGIVAVVGNNPKNGTPFVLTYKGPEAHRHGSLSPDGPFFVTSQTDDDLTAQIETQLHLDPLWEVFKSTPEVNSIIPVELNYALKTKLKDKKTRFSVYHPDAALKSFFAGRIQSQSQSVKDNFPIKTGNSHIPYLDLANRLTQWADKKEDPLAGFYKNKSLVFNVDNLTGTDGLLKTVLGFAENTGYSRTYTEFPDQVKDLLDASNSDKELFHKAIYDEIERRRYPHLFGVELNPLGVPDARIDEVLYPAEISSFIASGANADVKKYRTQFVNMIYNALYGDLDIAKRTLSAHDVDSGFTLSLFKHLLLDVDLEGRKGGLLRIIDDGLDPRERISKIAGLQRMSKAEFSRAMMYLGRDGIINRTNPGNVYNNVFRSYAKNSFEDAFHLAKLPPEWICEGGDESRLFLFEHNKFIVDIDMDDETGDIHKKRREAEKLAKIVFSFLCNAGLARDQAQLNGDKDAEREISQKFAWLSKRGPEKTVMDTLFALDKSYKIIATFNDYPKLLEQMLTAITLRTIKDSPFDDIDSLASINEDYSLEIETGNVTNAFFEHFRNENEDAPDYYDEELEEWVQDEPVDPAEVYDEFSAPDADSVKSWLLDKQYSFKEVLELNEILHKEHGKLIKEVNTYSDKDYHWNPLVDIPHTWGESSEHMTVLPITSRLDLLEEGSMMSHCVFSYLPACLSGDSMIFSIRDPLGERVATLELNKDGDGEDELPLFKIGQCFAKNNTQAPQSAWAAAESFIQQLNDREIQFNPDIKMDEDSNLLFDNAAEHPVTEGDLFTAIPYGSDAAYLLHEKVSMFLPKGKSVDQYFLDKGGCFTAIYSISQYRKDREQLSELSLSTGLSTKDLLSIKSQFSINNVVGLSRQIEALTEAHQNIVAQRDSLIKQGLTEAQTYSQMEFVPLPLLPSWGNYTKESRFMTSHIIHEHLESFKNSDWSLDSFLKSCPFATTSTKVLQERMNDTQSLRLDKPETPALDTQRGRRP